MNDKAVGLVYLAASVVAVPRISVRANEHNLIRLGAAARDFEDEVSTFLICLPPARKGDGAGELVTAA